MAQQGLTPFSASTDTVLFGRYKLLRELGRGGFAVVWEADDLRDGSRVAVKALEAENVMDPKRLTDMYARFIVEVEAVSRIKHPNVVAVHDAGTVTHTAAGLVAYYAMELVHGHTLDRVVKTHGALEPLLAARIIQQAANGIHAAHRHGIIHRDMKPQNIMLAFDARVVVMDFGICKLRGAQNITQVGMVVGTVRYLSPEQMVGEEVDASADVFSLGLVLYYLLTGQHLREQEDSTQLYLAMRQGGDLKRARESNIPAPLKHVLERALQPKRADRCPGADALAADLEIACAQVLGSDPQSPTYDRQRTLETLDLTTNTLKALAKGVTGHHPVAAQEPTPRKEHTGTSKPVLIGRLYVTCPECQAVFATDEHLAAHARAYHVRARTGAVSPVPAVHPQNARTVSARMNAPSVWVCPNCHEMLDDEKQRQAHVALCQPSRSGKRAPSMASKAVAKK